MSSIVLTGDTSGTVTVSAPAVAGTNTLTLPATSGTLLDSTSTLDATKLTGDLPAISGASLTSLPASGLGIGQTWQDVTASRANSTVYTNSTGKPIFVNISYGSSVDTGIFLEVDGASVSRDSVSSGDVAQLIGIVPNGSTYNTSSVGQLIASWRELR